MSALITPSQDLSKINNNQKILAIFSAINNDGDMLVMDDGYADALTNESNINTGSSLNEIYDGTLNKYGNVTAGSYTTGDRTGSITVTTDVGLSAGIISNLVDGGFGTNSTDSLTFTAVSVASKYFKFDLGSNTVIDECKWYQGGTTYSHGIWKWQGSTDDVSYSDIGSSFTLGGVATQTQDQLNGNTTAYRYYKLVGVSGTTSGSSWESEVEFRTAGSTADLTLLSNAFTCDAQPDLMNILLFHDPIDSITLNTDIKILVSRDNGTTYTEGVLSSVGPFVLDESISVLKASIDVSAQPAGSEFIWKVTTHNSKAQDLYGVAATWE